VPLEMKKSMWLGGVGINGTEAWKTIPSAGAVNGLPLAGEI
jgi:hypothetical protein